MDTRWPLGSFGNLEQSSAFVIRLQHPNVCRLWKVTTRPCGSRPSGKEISGQDLDALLVTDSESLQQKVVSTALQTEKTVSYRHGSASSRFASRRIRPGVGGLVEQPGEFTNEGSSWPSPTMAVKLPLLRDVETNCMHLDTVPTRIKTWADVSKH
jgi:hypothetical protein